MVAKSISQIKTALILLLLFTFITGIIYPAFVTLFAQVLFPRRSNGSLLTQQNQMIGSRWIGQSFTDPGYFWGRPSATEPFPYNAAHSQGSNLAPTNPQFLALVKQRVAKLHKADPDNRQPIPVDLVTTSASGLDPEISPLAAFYQIHRVAKARQLPEEKIQQLVNSISQHPFLGIIGESRVNVLELNLALDELSKEKQHA
jgi:K+-transporting ATPase ATPase C chain